MIHLLADGEHSLEYDSLESFERAVRAGSRRFAEIERGKVGV